MAVHPFGATLEVDYNNDAAFEEIAGVVSVSPPKIKVGSAETTVLNQANAWRTFLGGFVDGDSFNFTLRFVGDNGTDNFDEFITRERETFAWRVVLPLEAGAATPARLNFSGFFTELGIDEYTVDGDDVIDVSCTVKITDIVTFTPLT